MTKSSFHKLLLGSVLMLLPFTVQALVVPKCKTVGCGNFQRIA